LTLAEFETRTIESGKFLQQLIPEIQLLIFLAVQPTLAGPAQTLEPGGEGFGPGAGALRVLAAGLQAGQGNQTVDQPGLVQLLAKFFGVIAQASEAEAQAAGAAQRIGELVAQQIVGFCLSRSGFFSFWSAPERRGNQGAERIQLPALLTQGQQRQ